ncbi:MAG: DNA polymerase I [Candidatus Dadabacteria bacterium]|nr:DNA polymerase I [Candidatus Dadabacteria bacterium]MDE0477675.1 DNA polymerase I [Candidatus Dadabacteria bacterium]MXZ47985.1 DNA polymerase I [Candidatus Dadabacteria bacterium]MYE60803.1 DNA polymerase I [Candidatus Dadabacteria bacterium]
MSQHPLYLIDGSSYIFRAYYGVRADLSTSDGFPTNAVYGFATMLLKFLREYEPRYLGMVFDSRGEVFRNEIYPEYKANRDEAPESLQLQFSKIFELVRAFSIPMLAMEGYEADDIIGTIARAQGTSKVVLVTGDKDFCQLVSENVTLVDTMRERVTGVQEVHQKYGIEPGQMIDFFALVGDKVDNIPGVAGVGEKTASALISKYGNLDGVYRNLEELRPSVAKRLREHKDNAYLSRELVTIKTDVEVGTGIEDFRYGGYAAEDLQEIFSELEFEKLLDEIGASRTPGESEAVRYDSYETVFDEMSLGQVIRIVEEAGELSIDLETDSRLPMNAGIVGFSLCTAPGRAFYVPVGHTGIMEAEKQMKPETALSMLKPVLESEGIRKIGQNIKYDMLVLKNHGVSLRGIYFDTMLAAHLLDASRGSYKLDELSRTELGHKMISYDDVTGKGKSRKNFAEVDIETAARYSCEDSDVALILSRKFLETLKKEGLWDLYRENVLGLVPVLCDMEFTGVSVDTAILGKMSEEFERDLDSIEGGIYEKTEGKFNINSTKQLSEVLFEKLGLPVKKKTAKGAFSTDSEVLRDLSTIHEVPRLILRHRFLSKLKSTYIDQLPRLINPVTGRIHTSFNPAGTSTGRLSSSDPNLQNIPIKTRDGKRIRKSFVAKDGCVILSADYSQIELRLLAHFSEDPTLLEALRDDKDVHVATACEIFNASEDQITSEMRNLAKTINFGIIYGISAFGLSKQLGTTVSVSRNYINRYFDRYSEVKTYMQASVEEARNRGYTETLVGRRRPIPELVSGNRVERGRGEREAINTPIQGSAADIINLAMIRIFRRLEEGEFRSKMILQVHDELLFEVYEAELEKLRTHIKNDMENAWELRVPLRVEMRAAENWAEAH